MSSLKLGALLFLLPIPVSDDFILYPSQQPPAPPESPPSGVSCIWTRRSELDSSSPQPQPPPGPPDSSQSGFSSIWRRRRIYRSELDSSSPQPPPPIAEGEVAPSSPTIFKYKELASATNLFSNSNFLGQGGSGVVYKGVHPYDRQARVAIKQLKYGIQQAQSEFLNEIAIINRVHHRHLVSLVGYCINEYHSKMILVYEFVSNNTLAFHLHGTKTMDWKTRMKIAIGAAKGLAYLHEECHPKIIHGDIKASNILLDHNFEPKVADFGLPKFSFESQVIPRIMGGFGYLAPEYAASGNLTEKTDVFSFGVVLLELVTGRKPVGDTKIFPRGRMVERARPLFSEALDKGRLEGLVDSRLKNDYDVEEMFRMISCAANCVRHSAPTRPRMTEVVQALEGEIRLVNDMTVETGEASTQRRHEQDEEDGNGPI